MTNASKGRRRWSWAFRLAFGIALFVWVFRDADWGALADLFSRVDAAWLALATASVFLTVLLVALRWRLILAVRGTGRILGVLTSAVLVSQVANIVMPFKLGDAMRIGAVSRVSSLPASAVLGSVAVERLCEAAAVALAAAALLAAGGLPPFAHAGLTSLAITLAALLAAIVLTMVSARSGAAIAALPATVKRQLAHLSDGLARASRPRTLLGAIGLSVLVTASSSVTAWLVLRACALDLPASAAVVVTLALQIGGAVVPVPGGIGVAQVIVVQTLAIWGIAESPALACSLVLYFVARVPKIAVMPLALILLERTREPDAWR